MESGSPADIAQKLAQLKEEHRNLDRAISRLQEEPWQDHLMIKRLKKRKLKLKDWIAQLESQLIPDLDA